MRNKLLIFSLCFLLTSPLQVRALNIDQDSDFDSLKDVEELDVYHTNPDLADTDGDGYSDGDEVHFGFDPNQANNDRLEKKIEVSIKNQTLTYSLGPYVIKTLKVSTGDRKHPTPVGDYTILIKKPVVTYKGTGYYYPDTRWNMLFKKGATGNLYIHGAYWHNKFGERMSHGCVNVSYSDMETLYNWADIGTKVRIK